MLWYQPTKRLVLNRWESKSETGWEEHDTTLSLRKILKKVITEVPQRSVLESILFNTSIDFLFVQKSLMLIKYY